MRRRTGHALVLIGLLCASPAFAAWDFVPTPTEWVTWPLYCKVQYSFIVSGQDSEYRNAYPPSVKADWRGRLGEETFLGLHHWCASILYLNRSRAELDPVKHNFVLGQALGDAMFSFTRAEETSPVYPDMTVTVAQIKVEMGKPNEAIAILEHAIQVAPKSATPYVMLAMIYRNRGQLQPAHDALLKGDGALEGTSSELQYNLGLINLERGDVAAAVTNAHNAYALGYPLPGLRKKLERLGRWTEPPADDVATTQ